LQTHLTTVSSRLHFACVLLASRSLRVGEPTRTTHRQSGTDTARTARCAVSIETAISSAREGAAAALPAAAPDHSQ